MTVAFYADDRLMPMTDIPETGTKNWYLKIDTGFWHI